ncbi:putative quinol monooxygenase [Accumulibacter sp.]|uniref:putative quinol monooxygenase n=1 Tax=Accumulibacter sp. TaxID=2053492 RepID=UPI001D9730DA|nr:putative quinol monooxygenase [Accumulibacter sp.]MCB1968729.1 antibiotic biosynthesis monooxygenase [Accumulibacter sp.]MCP5229372.1 antibiotic biosynthesis monooxygenase [Accumulibacter sp.]
MTIRIMARLTARAGSETALATVLRELCGPSRAEDGCLGYDLFHNQDDAREFVTVELWTDQAAADAHLATAHVAEAVRLASELLAQPPLIHRFRQLA